MTPDSPHLVPPHRPVPAAAMFELRPDSTEGAGQDSPAPGRAHRSPAPSPRAPHVCCQWDQAPLSQWAREAARGVMARHRSAAQICIARLRPSRPPSASGE